MTLVYHGTPRLYPEAGPSVPTPSPNPSLPASTGRAGGGVWGGLSATASPNLLVPGTTPPVQPSLVPARGLGGGGGIERAGSRSPLSTGASVPVSPAIVLERAADDPASSAGTGARQMGVAAIRFQRPVRLRSVRVVPLGVVCPLGVGQTEPEPFTADLFLNIAPSDPVNALVRTSVCVTAAAHALDFELNMPEGTSTRLVVIRAPVEKLTLSLYAYGDEGVGSEEVVEMEEPALVKSQPTPLRLPDAAALLSALPGQPAGGPVRARVLKTLALLARTPRLSLSEVLAHWGAMAVLTSEASDDQQLQTTTAAVLGLDPEVPIVLDDGTIITPAEALRALSRIPGLARVAEYPAPTSAYALLVALARAQVASPHPRAGHALAVVVSRLVAVDDGTDAVVSAALARALPPLVAHACARGAVEAELSVPPTYARVVLDALAPVLAEVTAEGVACAPAVRELSATYVAALPANDPLRLAWADVDADSAAGSGMRTSTPGGAIVARALSAPSTSIHLSPTPESLLDAVAPLLLASLSRAPQPPLGLPRSLEPIPGPAGSGGGRVGSASHYAGKVYSAHEFRRERDTASGLGVGLAGVGRKASRHVDDFMA